MADNYFKNVLKDLKGVNNRCKIKMDSDSHAPSDVLDVLNIDIDLEHIQHVVQMFDARWTQMKENDKPDSLNILFYGVPGTGKTELAKLRGNAVVFWSVAYFIRKFVQMCRLKKIGVVSFCSLLVSRTRGRGMLFVSFYTHKTNKILREWGKMFKFIIVVLNRVEK